MREFATAAREREAGEERETVTWLHDGTEVTFLQPTATQMIIMAASAVADDDFAQAGNFLALFFELCDQPTRRHFRHRLFDSEDDFDIDGEGGVGDLMEALLEHWSGRPTKQPSDYRPSQSRTGRTSTATTRAKASTSSATRRVASSRSS